MTGEWRKLHNEDLNDLYVSLDIIRVIKSRRMRWAGHVASMGERRGSYGVLVGKPVGKRRIGPSPFDRMQVILKRADQHYSNIFPHFWL